MLIDRAQGSNDNVPLSILASCESVYTLKAEDLMPAAVSFGGSVYVEWNNSSVAYHPLKVLPMTRMIKILKDGQIVTGVFSQYGGMFPKQRKHTPSGMQYVDPQLQHKNGDGTYRKRVTQARPGTIPMVVVFLKFSHLCVVADCSLFDFLPSCSLALPRQYRTQCM
jgi:hypothetical protein